MSPRPHPADVIAEKARERRTVPAPAPAPARELPAPDGAERKARITADVTQADRRRLSRLVDDAAAARGWSRGNIADLFAATVAELLDDPELQRRVIDRMAPPARRRTR